MGDCQVQGLHGDHLASLTGSIKALHYLLSSLAQTSTRFSKLC